MITILQGNIFDSKAKALVNPINCHGVSGAGLALEFARRFPINDIFLHNMVECGKIRLGEVLPFYRYGVKDKLTIILNFPTKWHWTNKSSMKDIDKGLDSLKSFLLVESVESVAIPALGCGLGGLNWKLVRDLTVSKFEDCDFEIRVELYAPLRHK